MGLDRARVRHPEDRAVGDLTRDPEKSRAERGDEHRDVRLVGAGWRAETHVVLLAVQLDVLAAQQAGDDRHVLLGVTAGTRVREAERPFDHRLV